MKKVLLFLAFALVMQVAQAQINEIYLSNGVVLTGNQWHFDDYSVMEANDGLYVVITPNGYNYYQLQHFDKLSFELAYSDIVYSVKPYIYNNQFGWYVRGHYRNYFYYPSGSVIVLSYVPTFYTFHYDVARLTYLNLRHWHWRTAGLYHHLWHKPHHYHHPPQHHHHNHHPHHGHNGSHNRPEPPRNANGHATPPSRGTSVTKPATPPSRGTSVTRPATTTPSRGTTVARPASTQTSRSTTVARPASTQTSRGTAVARPASQPSRAATGHRR